MWWSITVLFILFFPEFALEIADGLQTGQFFVKHRSNSSNHLHTHTQQTAEISFYFQLFSQTGEAPETEKKPLQFFFKNPLLQTTRGFIPLPLS
jgi:hypothetical protein